MQEMSMSAVPLTVQAVESALKGEQPCKKCGNLFVLPNWHREISDTWWRSQGRSSECERHTPIDRLQVDEPDEHLHFFCRCGWDWIADVKGEGEAW